MDLEIPVSKELLEKLTKTLETLLDRCLINGRNVFWWRIEVPSLTEPDRADIYAFLHRVEVIHMPPGGTPDLIMVHEKNARAYLAKLRKSKQPDNERKNKKSKKAPTDYKISMNDAGEVLINDTKICRPHGNSENAWVIRYLCKNPDKSFSKEDLSEKIKKDRPQSGGVGKDLRKIVQNLNFNGDLQRAFFELHKKKNDGETILLKNPVTQKRLKGLGIDPPVLDLKRKSKIRRKNKKPKKT